MKGSRGKKQNKKKKKRKKQKKKTLKKREKRGIEERSKINKRPRIEGNQQGEFDPWKDGRTSLSPEILFKITGIVFSSMPRLD